MQQQSRIALAAIACTLASAGAYAAEQISCDDHGCRDAIGNVRAHHQRSAHKAPLRVRTRVKDITQNQPIGSISHPWIAEARRYVGGNPTGWSHEWCARFANLVLDRAGIRGDGSNLARDFSRYGDSVPPGTAGAIAVWPNHVAFVVHCARKRSCRFISGNDYGHLVRELERSTDGIIAWRMPHNVAAVVIPIPRPRPRPTDVVATIEHAVNEGVEEAMSTFASVLHRLRVWSHPGDTMMRQGPEHALSLLQPEFARRIAETIADARAHDIDACIFSSYRPPVLRVGGFKDKFNSLHAVGLAVDFCGIGAPGSTTARRFHRIAITHKVYCIYGPDNRAEWNHCQGTKLAVNPPALRREITARGPKDPARMWKVAERYMDVGPDRIAHSRRVRHVHRARQEAG